MRITRNFTDDEFRCKGVNCGCGNIERTNREFVAKLQVARNIAGIPFHISSGGRCRNHNRTAGGVEDSAHIFDDNTESKAADIRAASNNQRFVIVSALLEAGFTRIGIDKDKGFVHVDDDGSKTPDVMWVY